MLLMALPNEHLLTLSQYKDAKTLFEAIQARFGGKDATKKTQITILKQMYENFNAPSTKSLDSIFNRLQKIVSRLTILGENISQEDLNMKFLRSLPAEWNTLVVVWRNKVDIDTMSIDDLYNNFKIVEQEVKRTVFTSTPVSTVSSPDNTANLSDATMYAFLANQPNGSQLVHEDLEQIHEDDLEEMDLKWQLALLRYDKTKVECFNCHKIGHFARECRSLRNQESRPRNQDSSRKNVIVEDTSLKAMVAIDGAGFDWSYMANDKVPTNMALMAFSDSKIPQIKKVPDAPIIKDWVSDSDEDEYEEMVLKSKNVQHKTEQANQPRKANSVNTAKGNKVTSAVGNQGINAVKSSACWVRRPKIKVQDHVSKYSGSYICKRFDYVDPDGRLKHMIGNISFLTDFKEHDGGYVAFEGGAKGGKIAGKGTIRTATKDETSRILKSFITEIENLVEKKVKIIRCDNGTEFKNRVMNEFYKEKARTMLTDSKLPTIFWAEAVNTACYVQKRVLVVKPHFKTLYELFKGRTHALSFMRPFGCHVSILNTLYQLGKFDGKLDEEIFVGYSTTSKAFRVYNIRTRKVEENPHITFLENKPIIAGGGPEWLFDLDALSKSINYAPVFTGTNSNDFAGKRASFDVGQSSI
uniref:CCHC-type domain-containing protein n=1 Tax=Tanacetum cinerariifolium TaxID=118510 RepID=A0A6L2MFZ8_TANCI|nr:hypothetical protein [Tanacetum cinerariifolium]